MGFKLKKAPDRTHLVRNCGLLINQIDLFYRFLRISNPLACQQELVRIHEKLFRIRTERRVKV